MAFPAIVIVPFAVTSPETLTVKLAESTVAKFPKMKSLANTLNWVWTSPVKLFPIGAIVTFPEVEIVDALLAVVSKS